MKSREELEGDLSKAASEAHEWKQLMEFPAFQRYMKFMKEQQYMRQVTVCMTPINAEYTAFAQEFYKGEAAGLGLAMEFPQTMHQQAEMEKRTLTKELELYDSAEMDERAASAASASRFDGEPFGE